MKQKKKDILRSYARLLRSDYRHILCLVITLCSLAFGFLFPNGLPRLAEAFRDLGVSFAYYGCELFAGTNPILPTVIELPSWSWAPQVWEPLRIFPWTWEEFKVLCGKYFAVLFTKENFLGYFEWLGDKLYVLSRVLVVLLPIVLLGIMLFRRYVEKHVTARNKRSAPLRRFESTVFRTVYPAARWCRDFVGFLRENRRYIYAWLLIWGIHFNVFAIVVAFFAWYFYFASSFHIESIYIQVVRLLHDLAPMVRFIPGLVWLTFGVWVYNRICRSMAFARLYAYEKANRGFLSSRGIVTTIYGVMGIGKTQMLTSMALSAEIEQWDMAFDILLEKDMQFPNFPWQNVRDALKKEIENHRVVDIPTCRAWVRRCGFFFERITAICTPGEWRERKKRYHIQDYTFGYDWEHYRTTYNDELKITPLFEAVEDYACAYLIFTVKTTLLFSNYSIRTDSIIRDIGNMPLRDNDFMSRPPEYQEAYSHHAHIIDIDMLRLGKKMVADNPKARRLSFGVFVITEVDKEFKNMQELKETKLSANECNQRNDLHNACIMMSRHAAVIANRVFIRMLFDLQRPEAWGAGGRELGEVIYIADKGSEAPALPFFSPYWLCQGIFSWIKAKWDDFYGTYIHNRSDSTLFVHLCKNLVGVIQNHYDKVHGLLGHQALKLEVQSGRMDGEVRTDKWHRINKKDRSRRYRTACLETVFDSYEPNTMHIDDFIQYAGEVGTQEENDLQNSYFQNDIRRMKELNMVG